VAGFGRTQVHAPCSMRHAACSMRHAACNDYGSGVGANRVWRPVREVVAAVEREQQMVQEHAVRHERNARFRSLRDEGEDRIASACSGAAGSACARHHDRCERKHARVRRCFALAHDESQRRR
jgi:hypothetical protein